MSNVTTFCETLSVAERKAVIESYEKFERQGFIGDEPCRTMTKAMLKAIGVDEAHSTSIIMWMDQMFKECLRVEYRRMEAELDAHEFGVKYATN